MDTQAFEVRRRGTLYAVVGLAAGALAVLFGMRAVDHREQWWLWVVVAVLALIAYFHLVATLDARTPLFVADNHGVRLREGNDWAGIMWSDMGEIRVERREGWRHDPRIKVVSSDGSYVFTAPLGIATTASPAEAEVQLASRRRSASY